MARQKTPVPNDTDLGKQIKIISLKLINCLLSH